MNKIVVALAVVALVVGCYVPTPPSMICRPFYDTGPCIDGSWPEACISVDMSRCGYKVRGKFYECDNCDPLICDDAIYAGLYACYGGYYGDSAEEALSVMGADEVNDTKEAFVTALEELRLLEE